MCQLTYLDQAKFYMDPIFGFVAIDLGECKHFHPVGKSMALDANDFSVKTKVSVFAVKPHDCHQCLPEYNNLCLHKA